MGRKNRNKSPKALRDINNIELTGSMSMDRGEANAIVENSMDAVRGNMLTEKAQPDQINP